MSDCQVQLNIAHRILDAFKINFEAGGCLAREVKLREMLSSLIENGEYRRNRRRICAAVGISAAALSQYLTGRTRPSFDVLVRLADFFGVSLDYLVFGQQLRSEAATDYSPLARYLDLSLERLRADAQQRIFLTNQVGARLAERIDDAVVSALAETVGYGAGLMSDDDTMILESFSNETVIVSTDLQYDVIDIPGSSEGAAGRYFPIVAENIAQGRPYRFLLSNNVEIDWRDLAGKYRRMLIGAAGSDMVNANCHFRVSELPVYVGIGILKLDVHRLGAEYPDLAALYGPYIDGLGHLVYGISPSARISTKVLYDLDHLANARTQFDILWRRARPI